MSWPTCACGCGLPAPAIQRSDPDRGYVKGTPHKYVAGHQHQRFGERPYTVTDDGCWEWRSTGGVGYGTVKIAGKSVNVHRLFYEMHKGAIPPEFDLHHACQNRRCVNPEHLVALTRSQHIRVHRSAA